MTTRHSGVGMYMYIHGFAYAGQSMGTMSSFVTTYPPTMLPFPSPSATGLLGDDLTVFATFGPSRLAFPTPRWSPLGVESPASYPCTVYCSQPRGHFPKCLPRRMTVTGFSAFPIFQLSLVPWNRCRNMGQTAGSSVGVLCCPVVRPDGSARSGVLPLRVCHRSLHVPQDSTSHLVGPQTISGRGYLMCASHSLQVDACLGWLRWRLTALSFLSLI